MPLRFNCGEYRPGKKPIRTPGPKPNIPPVIILKGDRFPKAPPLTKDPPNQKDGYKCIDIGPLKICPTDRPHLVKPGIARKCIKCTPTEVILGFCTTLAFCKTICPSVPPICDKPDIIIPPVDPPPGDGGVTIPPVNLPPPPPIVIPPVGIPPTTGGGSKLPWKCVETLKFKECPPGFKVDGNPVWSERKCVQCTIQDLKNRDAECLRNKTAKQCGVECNSDTEPPCIPDGNTGIGTTYIVTPKSGTTKEPEVVSLEEMSKKSSFGSFGTIYNLNYNFVNWPRSDTIQVKTTSKYQNIFKPTVDENVEYILRNLSSVTPWNELAIASLTLEGIKASIRPELIEAFGRIKYLGGQPIGEDHFIGAIRDLMFSNRLDEFDDNYFINLGSSHASEDKVVYNATDDKSKKDQAGLGFVAEDSYPSDPESNTEDAKPFQRRARVLNEDIDLSILMDDCSGGTIVMDVSNAGMAIESCGDTKYALLGEGDGYYFSAQCDEKLIDTSSAILSAYSMPPESRFNALSVMGENSDYLLTVTGVDGNTELDSSYDLSSNLEPMFFSLDLSSVGKVTSINSLIVNTSASYTLLTEQSAIDTETYNNGWTATVANIDYEDPFLVYANESSSMNIEFKDISFLRFAPQLDIFQRTKLPRNIPFIIILSPGRGSEHNPFAGRSKLIESDTNVIRQVTMIPNFTKPDNQDDVTPLETVFALDEIGTASYGKIGANTPDADNVLFKFETSSTIFQNTYFNNGYSSDQPARAKSLIAKFIGIIDDLITDYDPEFLTWFDVGRRMTGDEYHELALVLTEDLKYYLSSGGRGVHIVDVLDRKPIVFTGITGDLTDTVILEESDRALDRITL